jgi:MFS family permease
VSLPRPSSTSAASTPGSPQVEAGTHRPAATTATANSAPLTQSDKDWRGTRTGCSSARDAPFFSLTPAHPAADRFPAFAGARAARLARVPDVSTFAPLRVRPFGRLLASYAVNETGDVLGAIALAILVFDRTGDPLAVAALLVAGKFAAAFVAPALTARVDQLAMRPVLTGAYVVEALLFVGLAALAGRFSLPVVLLLAFLDGTVALTARALTRGVVAATLGPAELLRAGNGLLNIVFAAASVGGAVAAGALVAAADPATALYADAASFAGAAVLMLTCRALPAAHEERTSFSARLREGLHFTARHRVLRLLLGGQALALVLFTLAVPVQVVYAKRTLDAGNLGFGLLSAAWGAGIVVGSGIFLLVRRRSPLGVVLASTAAVGLSYVGMAAVPHLGTACAFSVLGGVGNGIQWVSVVTLLQERTPGDLQARVSGLLESIGAALPGVGFLLGGVLASVLSAPATYAIAGGGVLVLVAAGAVLGLAALRPRPRPAAPSGGA